MKTVQALVRVVVFSDAERKRSTSRRERRNWKETKRRNWKETKHPKSLELQGQVVRKSLQ
ncbi:hypothetical protein HanXRQr2_Chr01g0034151 [Helianthus annuus]|uniref:Uncharacterized protein n=1 Tax=Helianthus annuus TaxID=4232 RepID=A0A9K3JWM5_HELAN|nr:hypothetical protein HanXRQr2_Chr01g0034151 [Helianthus annuus]KAJ0623932.1 hypothetical protein HanIR_Chr01g0037651 [Helianthus annuus]